MRRSKITAEPLAGERRGRVSCCSRSAISYFGKGKRVVPVGLEAVQRRHRLGLNMLPVVKLLRRAAADAQEGQGRP